MLWNPRLPSEHISTELGLRGIRSQPLRTERLNRSYHPRHIFLAQHKPVDVSNCPPGAAGQFAQQVAIVPEIQAEPFGDGEDILAVSNICEYIFHKMIGKVQTGPILSPSAWKYGVGLLEWEISRLNYFNPDGFHIRRGLRSDLSVPSASRRLSPYAVRGSVTDG